MPINESEKQRLLVELEQFYNELISYKELVLAANEKRLTYEQEKDLQILSSELQREYGGLEEVIEKYGGPGVLLLRGGNYKCEVFREMFNPKIFSLEALEGIMNTAITTVNMAIGKSKAEPEQMEYSRTVVSSDLPNALFDDMKLHPRIREASESLFKTQHYAQAIFEAFKAVNNSVKQKSGLSSLDGKDLMAKAFREDDPVIRLNEGSGQSDKNEQEGFKLLFMGAMVGIRNPKAHENVVQTDPFRTLEYLGFASLLLKRVEEGKVA